MRSLTYSDNMKILTAAQRTGISTKLSKNKGVSGKIKIPNIEI